MWVSEWMPNQSWSQSQWQHRMCGADEPNDLATSICHIQQPTNRRWIDSIHFVWHSIFPLRPDFDLSRIFILPSCLLLLLLLLTFQKKKKKKIRAVTNNLHIAHTCKHSLYSTYAYTMLYSIEIAVCTVSFGRMCPVPTMYYIHFVHVPLVVSAPSFPARSASIDTYLFSTFILPYTCCGCNCCVQHRDQCSSVCVCICVCVRLPVCVGLIRVYLRLLNYMIYVSHLCILFWKKNDSLPFTSLCIYLPFSTALIGVHGRQDTADIFKWQYGARMTATQWFLMTM